MSKTAFLGFAKSYASNLDRRMVEERRVLDNQTTMGAWVMRAMRKISEVTKDRVHDVVLAIGFGGGTAWFFSLISDVMKMADIYTRATAATLLFAFFLGVTFAYAFGFRDVLLNRWETKRMAEAAEWREKQWITETVSGMNARGVEELFDLYTRNVAFIDMNDLSDPKNAAPITAGVAEMVHSEQHGEFNYMRMTPAFKAVASKHQRFFFDELQRVYGQISDAREKQWKDFRLAAENGSGQSGA